MYTGNAVYRHSGHDWRVIAAFPIVVGGELGDGPKSYVSHYLAIQRLEDNRRIILDTDRGLSWPVNVPTDLKHVMEAAEAAGVGYD